MVWDVHCEMELFDVSLFFNQKNQFGFDLHEEGI